MEEQGNGGRPEGGQGRFGADAESGSPTASCELVHEDGVVGPREDQPEGENNATSGNRTPATVAQHDAPHEEGRRKADAVSLAAAGAEADKSPAAGCFEREMGPHLAAATGGRCRLKAVGKAGAAHTETPGEAEEPSRKERAPGGPGSVQGPQSTGDTAAHEPGGGTERGPPSRFAGAVSRRAGAGMAAQPEGGPGFSGAADPHPQPHLSSDTLPVPAEEADPLLGPPLVGREGVNKESAGLKREGELVCLSAPVPPLLVPRRLPEGDG